MEAAAVDRNTKAREKVKNVARPDDADPTDETSKLAKQAEIKVKIIDEQSTIHSVHVKVYDKKGAEKLKSDEFHKHVKNHGGEYHYSSDKGVAFKFKNASDAEKFHRSTTQKYRDLGSENDGPMSVNEANTRKLEKEDDNFDADFKAQGDRIQGMLDKDKASMLAKKTSQASVPVSLPTSSTSAPVSIPQGASKIGIGPNDQGPVDKFFGNFNRKIFSKEEISQINTRVNEVKGGDQTLNDARTVKGGVTQIDLHPKTVDKDNEADKPPSKNKKIFKDQGVFNKEIQKEEAEIEEQGMHFGNIGTGIQSKMNASLRRRKELEKQNSTRKMNLRAGNNNEQQEDTQMATVPLPPVRPKDTAASNVPLPPKKPKAKNDPTMGGQLADTGMNTIESVLGAGELELIEKINLMHEDDSFGSAFASARKKAGGAGGMFTYNGKQYQTNVAGEKYVKNPKSVDEPANPGVSSGTRPSEVPDSKLAEPKQDSAPSAAPTAPKPADDSLTSRLAKVLPQSPAAQKQLNRDKQANSDDKMWTDKAQSIVKSTPAKNIKKALGDKVDDSEDDTKESVIFTADELAHFASLAEAKKSVKEPMDKPTVGNQAGEKGDQSGENPTNSTARYDISDEKKLVGKQHKLDKNHNGKIDAEDFKLLRKEDSDGDTLAATERQYAANKLNMVKGKSVNTPQMTDTYPSSDTSKYTTGGIAKARASKGPSMSQSDFEKLANESNDPIARLAAFIHEDEIKRGRGRPKKAKSEDGDTPSEHRANLVAQISDKKPDNNGHLTLDIDGDKHKVHLKHVQKFLGSYHAAQGADMKDAVERGFKSMVTGKSYTARPKVSLGGSKR